MQFARALFEFGHDRRDAFGALLHCGPLHRPRADIEALLLAHARVLDAVGFQGREPGLGVGVAQPHRDGGHLLLLLPRLRGFGMAGKAGVKVLCPFR